MTSTCSTHVLDSARGRPAAGIGLRLLDADGATVADTRADDDGRVRFEGQVAPGRHTLVVDSGAYFAAQDLDTFYPEVVVAFDVSPGEHHHVAVLLAPFAYTTYRGS
ncbi:hydroxyisourate hydrolase [Nocardioides lacusdianchii]|uniref:hydroxyisourate hydrolase n=1 Tax=Nocardioides lacusdianchii TaxID=2783664 RepID=UPI001CCC7E69|nr:hydroxyisourate hydrolase [Nocardioides lacusdianchii]